MRAQIKHHAPYLYLVLDSTTNRYHLFVAIPTRIGYQLAPGNITPQYRVGMTEINIRLEKQNAVSASVINQHFQLSPPAGFNIDSDEIVVTVSVLENDGTLEEEELFSALMYRDCDDQPLHINALGDKKAYNCPYTYLEQIGTNQASTPLAYEPYLLVSLNGYRFNSDRVLLTTPNNGVCETVIVLSDTQTNGSEGSYSHNFQINRDRYYDSGRIEGNFSVTVLLEDNVPDHESLSRSPLREVHSAIRAIDLRDEIANNPEIPRENGGNGFPQDIGNNDNEGDIDVSVEEQTNGNGGITPPQTLTQTTTATASTATVSKKTSKTRNMSSRRRSPIFLDFRRPKADVIA